VQIEERLRDAGVVGGECQRAAQNAFLTAARQRVENLPVLLVQSLRCR
jgi:hypothetical protein